MSSASILSMNRTVGQRELIGEYDRARINKFARACEVLRAHGIKPVELLGKTCGETEANIIKKARELQQKIAASTAATD